MSRGRANDHRLKEFQTSNLMIGTSTPTVKASARLPFQFRPMPVAAESLGLPSTALHLFTILIDDAKRRGWRTRLLNPALASRLGRSVATVKRLLALLESRGLIQREHAADGRIRTATRITWDGVAQSCATEQKSVAHSQSGGGSLMRQGVAHSCATNSERPQSAFQTPGFSTSEEEKREEPAPSPAETAAALRAMVAGKWAPMIFDEAKPHEAPAKPATSPETSPTPSPVESVATSTTRAAASRETPPTRPQPIARPYGGLPLHRAGVSAAAAAFSPKFGAVRNTPESLNRQLWERRQRVGPPSPPPASGGPPPTGERPAILPNPPSRGALANPGKV